MVPHALRVRAEPVADLARPGVDVEGQGKFADRLLGSLVDDREHRPEGRAALAEERRHVPRREVRQVLGTGPTEPTQDVGLAMDAGEERQDVTGFGGPEARAAACDDEVGGGERVCA